MQLAVVKVMAMTITVLLFLMVNKGERVGYGT